MRSTFRRRGTSSNAASRRPAPAQCLHCGPGCWHSGYTQLVSSQLAAHAPHLRLCRRVSGLPVPEAKPLRCCWWVSGQAPHTSVSATGGWTTSARCRTHLSLSSGEWPTSTRQSTYPSLLLGRRPTNAGHPTFVSPGKWSTCARHCRRVRGFHVPAPHTSSTFAGRAADRYLTPP